MEMGAAGGANMFLDFLFFFIFLQSISFEEFKSFCLFTNNMDDFAFTMKMISEANRPIKMGKWYRLRIDPTPLHSGFLVSSSFCVFNLVYSQNNCIQNFANLKVRAGGPFK